MNKEESRRVKEGVELYRRSMPHPRTETHERDWSEMSEDEREEWMSRAAADK